MTWWGEVRLGGPRRGEVGWAARCVCCRCWGGRRGERRRALVAPFHRRPAPAHIPNTPHAAPQPWVTCVTRGVGPPHKANHELPACLARSSIQIDLTLHQTFPKLSASTSSQLCNHAIHLKHTRLHFVTGRGASINPDSLIFCLSFHYYNAWSPLHHF